MEGVLVEVVVMVGEFFILFVVVVVVVVTVGVNDAIFYEV